MQASAIRKPQLYPAYPAQWWDDAENILDLAKWKRGYGEVRTADDVFDMFDNPTSYQEDWEARDAELARYGR